MVILLQVSQNLQNLELFEKLDFGVFPNKNLEIFLKIAKCGKIFLYCPRKGLYPEFGFLPLLEGCLAEKEEKFGKNRNYVKEEYFEKKRFHSSERHLQQSWGEGRLQKIPVAAECLDSSSIPIADSNYERQRLSKKLTVLERTLFNNSLL